MKIKRLFSHIRTRIMRGFFNLLYHQLAWSYDFVASLVSLGNWKRWIITVLPHLEGPRVLELGHGPGHLQCALLNKGINAFGIDESRSMGILAGDRIKKHVGITNLVRGYAQKLPVHNQSIHQVVATFPSEYITDPLTFSEVHRVLVPGGKLIAIPFAEITGHKWLDRLANWLFSITGQTTHWDDQMLTPFRMAGFETKLEHVSGESWRLTIIIGLKLTHTLPSSTK